MRFCMTRRTSWIAALVALVALSAVPVASGGCKPINEPTFVDNGGVPVNAPTVQASMTAEATSAAAAAGSGAAAGKRWPSRVVSFANSVKHPVWYPATLPPKMKLDSIDVIEMEPKTGLVCDAFFLGGAKSIRLTQGSPTARDYDIVSVEKVPWGTVTADVVHADPEDATTPRMIVLRSGGNLAELSGDVSLEVLKSVAASMQEVR